MTDNNHPITPPRHRIPARMTMTDSNHPITPPNELVKQWVSLACEYEGDETWIDLATQAAQWGWQQRGAVNEAELQKARDEELLESCKWLHNARNHGLGYDIGQSLAANLRAARRPKSPSLKEQALAKLEAMERLWEASGNTPSDLVRRAIESLPD